MTGMELDSGVSRVYDAREGRDARHDAIARIMKGIKKHAQREEKIMQGLSTKGAQELRKREKELNNQKADLEKNPPKTLQDVMVELNLIQGVLQFQNGKGKVTPSGARERKPTAPVMEDIKQILEDKQPHRFKDILKILQGQDATMTLGRFSGVVERMVRHKMIKKSAPGTFQL